MPSRCWAEISKGNLAYNINQLQNYLPENTGIIAIVKANSYGHCAELTVPVLEECGISDFAVADIDEAISMRNNGCKSSILILSYVDRDDWPKIVQYDCIASIVSVEHAHLLNQWAVENNVCVKAEVKVDTGMRRIGLPAVCSDTDIINVYGLSNLLINGTFSHFCCADSFDDKDREFTAVQNERFSGFLKHVRDLGYNTGRTHLCASSGFLNYPEIKYDYVRPGFIMYGYYVGDIEHRYDVKPVMSLKAKINNIKFVEPKEGISYGRIYFTDKRRKIATVSAGYADGYLRGYSRKASVLVHGIRVPVVGRICMDQMMIDVTDIPDVAVEDVVTLYGPDGNDCISIDEAAQWADSVGSEIVCLITPRVKRYLVD